MASRRTLTDGSVVQFLSQGKATITGAFTTALAQYDVVDQAAERRLRAHQRARHRRQRRQPGGARGSHQGHGSGHHASARPRGRHAAQCSRRVRSCSCRWRRWSRWIPRRVVTSLFNLPAVFIVLAVTMLLVHRRVRIGDRQQHHRRHQGHGDHRVHRGRRVLREPRQLASVHSRAHRASRTNSASTASFAPRRSCSSPTSASRRSRPPDRKRRIRARTCPSASWAR